MWDLSEIFSYTILILICALIFTILYSVSTYGHWKNLGILYPKPMPMLGNTWKFVLNRSTYQDDLKKIYDFLGEAPFGGFFQLRTPHFFPKDPQLISDILITGFSHFQDHGFEAMVNSANRKLNPLSGHLFVIEGPRWKILRQKLSPVFSYGKIKPMIEQVKTCSNTMMKVLSDRCDFNAKIVAQQYTTDVIGATALGLDFKSLTDANSPLYNMVWTFFQPRLSNLVKLFFVNVHPKLLDVFGIPDNPKGVTRFFMAVVDDIVRVRKDEGLQRNDFFQLLLELKEKNNGISSLERFDDLDVKANAFLFFLAGIESPSSTLSLLLFEIARNPGIQEKMVLEMNRIFEKYEDINADALKELNYTEMVIYETLRKYPIVTSLDRICNKNYTIPGTQIVLEVGTKVSIPVYSLHHDEKYYPNPEVFDPERFSLENKGNIQSGTYMPFGLGPRVCPGSKFAIMELKIVLFQLLRNYHVFPSDKSPAIGFQCGTTFLIPNPKKGIWVNIAKRA